MDFGKLRIISNMGDRNFAIAIFFGKIRIMIAMEKIKGRGKKRELPKKPFEQLSLPGLEKKPADPGEGKKGIELVINSETNNWEILVNSRVVEILGPKTIVMEYMAKRAYENYCATGDISNNMREEKSYVGE